MLKSIVRFFYRNRIYSDEPELFYKIYKWCCGLFTLIAFRMVICTIVFFVNGIFWMIFIKPRIYGLAFIDVGLLFFFLEKIESDKQEQFNVLGIKTPAQIRAMYIEDFIRRYVTTNGMALGKKEWEEIKKHDIGLYNDLLSDNCNHCCYFYSLEIAKIIQDSILIWGAVEEPFEEGHKFYAHAIILRNGYVYDSNLRQSVKYEDFVKLFKFKTYKQWKYDKYSLNNFRAKERARFREWCEKNNILAYMRF